MTAIDFVLLYVANPRASARFYARLFGREPVELSDTFAMFVLGSGAKLGLWGRSGVEPAPSAMPGASEIASVAADQAAVEATYATWTAQGVTIIQPPSTMDFGFTFTAADPDGHRIRVFAPAPD